MSDHIIKGCDELYVHMTVLFNTILSHSYVPKDMLLSALLPIPKKRKRSVNNSDNYRSIALSSIVGEVLDNIILTKHANFFVTSDLQFGFNAKHSTRQCTFVLKEVVDFHIEHNSPCYAVLLDASKSFFFFFF